jgi:RNA polymerase sigma-70 factor, ECF subfamily
LSTALAQAPPADATRLLYERHSSRIFGFCLSRLGSREEAEDALQTTFLNAQRGLGRGVIPEYELAWLFKIAQNVCHNRHQSARRRGRVEAAQDLDALQDVIASPERGAAVSLGELTRALGAIPTRQRRALVLREFQGYSYEEIAGELGISVAAVETLLFRARRAVAQQLEQSGATSRPRRGAAASAIEIFRWLFGGSAVPLKLAAVTAAVATTATVSLVPTADGHKRAPAAPVVVKARSVPVGPASKVPQRHLVPDTVRAPKVPASDVPSSGATASVPAAPAVQAAAPATDTQRGASQTAPGLATTILPAVVVPDPPTPKVVLPGVSVPDLPLRAVTVPSVDVGLSLPAVTLPLPAVSLPLPQVALPDVQVTLPPLSPKLP